MMRGVAGGAAAAASVFFGVLYWGERRRWYGLTALTALLGAVGMVLEACGGEACRWLVWGLMGGYAVLVPRVVVVVLEEGGLPCGVCGVMRRVAVVMAVGTVLLAGLVVVGGRVGVVARSVEGWLALVGLVSAGGFLYGLVSGGERWLSGVVLAGVAGGGVWLVGRGMRTEGVFALVVVLFGLLSLAGGAAVLLRRTRRLYLTAQRLEDSNRRFYQVADAISEAFWLSDLRDGTLLYLNEAFSRIWEMPVSEVLADPEAWMGRVHPDDREYVRRAFRELEGNDRLEYRLRFEAGREKWVSDGLYVLRDGEGRPYRLARVIEEVTSRKRVEQELTFLAFYDTLTCLPNRRSFFERFEDTVVREGAGNGGAMRAIVMMDLDNFKAVNDAFGHATADKVLAEVARRLRAFLGPRDHLFRLGSDEFVAVLAGQTDEELTRATVGRMMEAVAAPVEVGAFAVTVSSSAGVSFYPRDGSTREELVRNADIALVQAKRDRNTVRIFRPRMLEEANRRMGILNRLRPAMERGEFFVEYQPVVDASGRVVSAEALVRWRDAVSGRVVGPSEFVGIAEETGLIVPLGLVVLREACRCRKVWPVGPEFRLSVNISARQFRQKDFVERFLGVVAEEGLEPSMLDCEITESSVMESPEESIRKMRALAEAGVSFSLDDFGTGYSSLAYLHRFPVRSLKVDRSFVAGLGAAEDTSKLLETVIGLAHGMGLLTVAEGVETEGQWVRLKGMGCDRFQGFLFSEAVGCGRLAGMVGGG